MPFPTRRGTPRQSRSADQNPRVSAPRLLQNGPGAGMRRRDRLGRKERDALGQRVDPSGRGDKKT